MNKHTILVLVVVLVAAGAYFILMSEDASAPITDKTTAAQDYADGTKVVYCDEEGNRYDTEAAAKAAGLTEAQYGATYCPEYSAGMNDEYRSVTTLDYVGLSTADAEQKAQLEGVMFRVVEEDGKPLPTTRDFQEGRINATVEKGFVTKYSVETNNPTPEEKKDTNDAIIGMTTVQAKAYAETKGVDFRTGTVDGVAMPVTLDFRPGRITADVKSNVVVSYTVE